MFTSFRFLSWLRPRHQLFDAAATKLTNRVGLLMLVPSFGLALLVGLTDFDLREYPSLGWLFGFHSIRLHAAASLYHEREALVVWSYLCLSSPLFFIYFLLRADGIAAESARHLLWCTIFFAVVAGLSFCFAWAVGFFEPILTTAPSIEPKQIVAIRVRTTLSGMVLTAVASHFSAIFCVVVVIRVWVHRASGG